VASSDGEDHLEIYDTKSDGWVVAQYHGDALRVPATPLTLYDVEEWIACLG
jgi:hypothetical protein